jgi:predicted nucleic acid-binding protein
MILVDTSVWIDFLEGKGSPHHFKLRSLLEQDEDIFLTGIVLTEILQGIRDEELNKRTEEYLLAFPLVHARDIATYLHAAELYRTCARRGLTVRKTIDCIIAAIAIENSLALFHNDRDFVAIEACCGLKTYNP